MNGLGAVAAAAGLVAASCSLEPGSGAGVRPFLNPAASTHPAASTIGAHASRGVGQDSVSTKGGRPIKGIIADAKKSDPQGFRERLQTLKSSEKFVSFLTARAGSPEAGGIEGLAAILTADQARKFVGSLAGKVFVVTRDAGGAPEVELVDSSHVPSPAPSNGETPLHERTRAKAQTASFKAETAGWTPPSCWQGWFAAAGYSAATGAICGAVGAMSFGTVGAWCAAAAWAGAMGINWNDACG